jgi:hypothetical protein
VLDGEKWPHYERVQVVELESARALAAAESQRVRAIVFDIEARMLTSEAAR